MTVFFATSPHRPEIVDSLCFPAYSRDEKVDIVTCMRFEIRGNRILKCICICHSFIYFIRLLFDFPLVTALSTFIKHITRVKKIPCRLGNKGTWRLETAPIFDSECHSSCLWAIKGILWTIVFVYRKNKMTPELNLQMVKFKTKPLPLPSYILPDITACGLRQWVPVKDQWNLCKRSISFYTFDLYLTISGHLM